jgi:predicted MFS family arabinose efflux permease
MTPSQTIALSLAFKRLSLANLLAQLAEQISLAAVPIVAVLALGAGPGEIGFLASFQTLPFLLLSIPLGLLADRTSRKRLMAWAEVLRAASLVGMFISLWVGGLSIPLLAALGFAGAVGTVAFSVAAPALVPSLVDRADLARANGRLELARSLAYAGGPALAGALVAWAGGTVAFVLAAVLSVAAVALLAGLREPARAKAAGRHPWLELKDGALFVWRHEFLKPIVLTAVAWNMAWFVLQAAYVPYAVRVLGLGAAGVGVTLAIYGTGMIVGALLAPRIVAVLPFGRAIQLGPAFSVLASMVMLATLWVPNGAMAGLSFFLFGAGPTVWVITSVTLRQTVTPGRMLGRVSAVFLTVNMGVRPFAAALGGLVGAAWGEAACLALSLAFFAVQLLVILRSPVSQLKRLPAAAD